ncbi:MAG: hypothetical protein A3E36_04150 [Candidatus Andersenbacteria bacterium RIFCSPHIGHO2_12_FULL_45_11b]|uniref:O-antigen ligase-related domain-containing protein n=1 Tax=Candidatus Andersenbacteria bacterium RIFCSPHIGHO2_12_FULL_45_11b TaxID=1797282 RepID=A0A1G1XA30_9BACT|nr:MAG: hypothetical protein A3E36_04150 [Candidatus Andersenbacteria bacterium RIFCSPHIGHO2_12_FULL_45_11b]
MRKWALGAVFLSIIAGQIIRIPITGQGGGILASDIAAGILILTTVLRVLFGAVSLHAIMRPVQVYSAYILPFFVFSLGALAIHGLLLGAGAFSVALLYLIRLFALSLLFPVFLLSGAAPDGRRFLRRGFVAIYWVLIALGYGQIVLFPSLVGNINGWDPHVNRMIATWFDPNFFGAFIALGMLPALYYSRAKIGMFAISFGALLLTGSRSSWVAFAGACAVTGFLALIPVSLTKTWKNTLGIALFACTLCVLLVVGAFPDRVAHFFTHDPTIALRADAYRVVWHRLVEPHVVFGVGYNAYQFSAKNAGLIADFSIHSRAGSDSSIFTLLVTGGIIGTCLFLMPIAIAVYWHGVQWLLRRRTQSLLFIWSASALFIHAQFENSLLYPHLLIVFLLISALCMLRPANVHI